MAVTSNDQCSSCMVTAAAAAAAADTMWAPLRGKDCLQPMDIRTQPVLEPWYPLEAFPRVSFLQISEEGDRFSTVAMPPDLANSTPDLQEGILAPRQSRSMLEIGSGADNTKSFLHQDVIRTLRNLERSAYNVAFDFLHTSFRGFSVRWIGSVGVCQGVCRVREVDWEEKGNRRGTGLSREITAEIPTKRDIPSTRNPVFCYS